MKEWIRKDEVLDLLRSLPHDIVDDHIFELKGIWADEDFNQWNSPDNTEILPEPDVDYLLKLPGPNGTTDHVMGFCDSEGHWMDSRECIPIAKEEIVGWMSIPE